MARTSIWPTRPQAELAEISAILWAKYAPFLPDDSDDLTPDELREKPDTAEGLDALVPDALREKPEDPNLEPDPLGLTPGSLRAVIADPGLARRLAMGTATPAEKIDALLTPDELK